MNEIERAIHSCQNKIRKYEKRLSGADFHRTETMNAISLEKIKVSALREQAEREKGCRYCNGNISDALGTPIYSFKVQYFEIGDGAVHMLHARYCPMCGRQLKEDI